MGNDTKLQGRVNDGKVMGWKRRDRSREGGEGNCPGLPILTTD